MREDPLEEWEQERLNECANLLRIRVPSKGQNASLVSVLDEVVERLLRLEMRFMERGVSNDPR